MNALAEASPVLVAIDDVQWLDTASAVVLEFALRRLRGARVGVLAARRTSENARLQLEQLVEAGRVREVRIGPLSLAATHHVLERHFDHAPSRPLLVRIHRTAAGNPLFALEIARALEESGDRPRADDPLPVPSDVEALVRRRVAALQPGTREVLLAAAALGSPRVAVLREAVDCDVDSELKQAEQRAIASTEHGVVAFAHPLFGAALYNSAAPADRQDVHRRLAEVVVDPEERARHLALGADGPDETVAQALEGAAGLAATRGSPATSAELLELALRATPEPSTTQRRTVELARYLYTAGDFGGSSEVLEGLVDRLADGELRAQALLLLADIEYWTKSAEAACARAAQALSATQDPLLRARCHAVIGISSIHDVSISVAEAESALRLLDEAGVKDRATLSLALCTAARGGFFLGRGLDEAALTRAAALEDGTPPAFVQDRARFKLGQLLKYIDDLNGSRLLLEESLRAALDEGDEGSLVNVLVNLTVTECWSGSWARARELAERAVEVAARLGAYPQGAASYLAYVDAHVGNVEAVSRVAGRTEASGEPVVDAFLAQSLGLVRLARGEHVPATENFDRALELYGAAGFTEPAVFRVHGDAIEAALASDAARAEALLEPFERHSRRVPIPWSIAVSARCRALIDAARGDLDQATSAIEHALVAHERSPVPFELARTLLVAGQLHRRANRRRAAADALERSERCFVELGAPLWAERAREELARVPLKRRSGVALTPAEERVAALVAQGHTNQEIAQALFVTKKTVEANLTRIYRKLGVRSRSALVAQLQSRPAEGEAAKV